MINLACNDNHPQQKADLSFKSPHAEGSFGYDADFLQQHDSIIILQATGGEGQVIVSPKYQAKVFTSTANGNEGISFGWVNYKAFTAPPDEHMNAYGGENRLWLGPEGGKFSLYFKPGAEMVFANWKTPAAIDTESWKVSSKSSNAVSMLKEMTLMNYKGSELQLQVSRSIKILEREEIISRIGISSNSSAKVVGYKTENVLTNKGSFEWDELTGMPCMWLLDMFKPSPFTTIIIPLKNEEKTPFKQVATTNYFGEIASDRLQHTNQVLYFKADGKSRGKLGILPNYAKSVAGSYDAQNKVLTIVMFDIDARGKYLNQEWSTTRPTFSGDAINAYNDGPLADGTQMGPFYEIESVSPAAFLKPNQSLSHTHSVFHFTGSDSALDSIAKQVFDVTLDEIRKIF